MSVSRRKLLQVLPAAAAAAQASAQVSESPANPDAGLETARRYQLTVAQTVRQVAIPQGTEPAFRFVPRS